MAHKDYLPYGIAFIVLFIGAFYDYPITDMLYHKASLFGIFFERIALIPIQSVVMFTMCMLYCHMKKPLFLLCAVMANVYVIHHTLSYWLDVSSTMMNVVVIVLAVCTTLVTWILLRSVDPQWIKQHLSFFLFFTAVLLSAALITTLIKAGWGRIRYRDMQSTSQFCVWYKPCGAFGNRSFPSGHTTGMSALLCTLQWKYNRYERASRMRYVWIAGGIVFMALSRMIMGAHFLSDTAAGFIVTYTCYLLFRTQFQRRGYL